MSDTGENDDNHPIHLEQTVDEMEERILGTTSERLLRGDGADTAEDSGSGAAADSESGDGDVDDPAAHTEHP